MKEGKIRGWGMCNDNAYGLAASCAAARECGVPPPVVMQNDFRLLVELQSIITLCHACLMNDWLMLCCSLVCDSVVFPISRALPPLIPYVVSSVQPH